MTHFDRIDGDGDGSITKEEFRTGFWVLASQGAVTSESIARRGRRVEEEAARPGRSSLTLALTLTLTLALALALAFTLTRRTRLRGGGRAISFSGCTARRAALRRAG